MKRPTTHLFLSTATVVWLVVVSALLLLSQLSVVVLAAADDNGDSASVINTYHVNQITNIRLQARKRLASGFSGTNDSHNLRRRAALLGGLLDPILNPASNEDNQVAQGQQQQQQQQQEQGGRPQREEGALVKGVNNKLANGQAVNWLDRTFNRLGLGSGRPQNSGQQNPSNNGPNTENGGQQNPSNASPNPVNGGQQNPNNGNPNTGNVGQQNPSNNSPNPGNSGQQSPSNASPNPGNGSGGPNRSPGLIPGIVNGADNVLGTNLGGTLFPNQQQPNPPPNTGGQQNPSNNGPNPGNGGQRNPNNGSPNPGNAGQQNPSNASPSPGNGAGRPNRTPGLIPGIVNGADNVLGTNLGGTLFPNQQQPNPPPNTGGQQNPSNNGPNPGNGGQRNPNNGSPNPGNVSQQNPSNASPNPGNGSGRPNRTPGLIPGIVNGADNVLGTNLGGTLFPNQQQSNPPPNTGGNRPNNPPNNEPAPRPNNPGPPPAQRTEPQPEARATPQNGRPQGALAGAVQNLGDVVVPPVTNILNNLGLGDNNRNTQTEPRPDNRPAPQPTENNETQRPPPSPQRPTENASPQQRPTPPNENEPQRPPSRPTENNNTQGRQTPGPTENNETRQRPTQAPQRPTENNNTIPPRPTDTNNDRITNNRPDQNRNQATATAAAPAVTTFSNNQRTQVPQHTQIDTVKQAEEDRALEDLMNATPTATFRDQEQQEPQQQREKDGQNEDKDNHQTIPTQNNNNDNDNNTQRQPPPPPAPTSTSKTIDSDMITNPEGKESVCDADKALKIQFVIYTAFENFRNMASNPNQAVSTFFKRFPGGLSRPLGWDTDRIQILNVHNNFHTEFNKPQALRNPGYNKDEVMKNNKYFDTDRGVSFIDVCIAPLQKGKDDGTMFRLHKFLDDVFKKDSKSMVRLHDNTLDDWLAKQWIYFYGNDGPSAPTGPKSLAQPSKINKALWIGLGVGLAALVYLIAMALWIKHRRDSQKALLQSSFVPAE